MRLGAHERTGGGGKFYVIKHHCICEESKTAKPGYEPRDVLNPQTNEQLIRYIKPYGSLIGFITDIEYRDTEDRYDQQYVDWRVHLNLGDETGVLNIPFHSRHSTRFMMLAENIDFTRPVEFRAWKDNEGGTAFYVGQFENDDDEKSVKVEQKYRRGEMGDCPEGEKVLGGKWNFDDQNKFLYGRMMDVVIPSLKAIQGNGHVPAAAPALALPASGLTREEWIDKISGLCRDLNNAGDTIKWAKATLNSFVNETYQVSEGMDSMTLETLPLLANLLEQRLKDLDVPF